MREKMKDFGKLRYDLLDPDAMHDMVLVLTFGVQKYSDNGWQDGIEASRLFAAAQRHLWAWASGERLDPETQVSHLSHAMARLQMLHWMERNRPDMVDLPRRGSPAADRSHKRRLRDEE